MIAVSEQFISSLLRNFSYKIPSNVSDVFPSQPLPSTSGFNSPFSDLSFKHNETFPQENLKYLVNTLTNYLIANCGRKHVFNGFIQSLFELSEEYIITKYNDVCNCNASTNNTFSLAHFLVSSLNSHPTVICDLSTHAYALKLTGNLISGLCYETLKAAIHKENSDSSLYWGFN